MKIRHLAPVVLVSLLLAGPSGSSAPVSGTLALDGLSFVSFGGVENIPLPPGSTIRFDFGTPASDGSVPFTISPAGVSIPEIPIGSSGATLRYTLASPASGTMWATAEGRKIEFNATVSASLIRPDGTGTFQYAIPFTTETAQSTSADGTLTLERTGMRLVEGVWYAQIVGATVNKTNAFPEPGTAVYTVLSGSFDQVP